MFPIGPLTLAGERANRRHSGDAVQLVLTDEETAASDATETDHYPLSPRVQTRRAILNKIRPELPGELRAASLAMSPARRPSVNKFTRRRVW